ncbi:MAG TPA: hypothetical protein VM537_29880 [Anaerolineae bacterium]|nr:hypothetical protein [Anaerolineae bacterium]
MLKESAPTQLQMLTAPFVPAHVANHNGGSICSWCRVPVQVERLPEPHITVPACAACRAMLRGDKQDGSQ